MSYLRLAGLAAGALAVVGAIWWIIATLDKARDVDRFRACSKAAASETAPIAACDATISPLIERARRAAACEAALAPPNDGKLYAVRAVCGEQVKRLDATLTATRTDLADARAQIAAAQADRDQAVQRAEARTITTATKKAADVRTIQNAPRLGDGRVRCDAQCLRDLAGR